MYQVNTGGAAVLGTGLAVTGVSYLQVLGLAIIALSVGLGGLIVLRTAVRRRSSV